MVLRAVRMAIDVVLLAGAYWLATQARFDWEVPPDRMRQMMVALPFVVLLQVVAKRFTGVDRASWRASSLGDLGNLVRALTIASLVLLLLRTSNEVWQFGGLLGRVTTIPYGILIMNFVCAVGALGGARAVRRHLIDRANDIRTADSGDVDTTLLVGAGKSGIAVARELRAAGGHSMRAVGFLDDDVCKHGLTIQLLPVLGSIDDLAVVARDVGASTVLLTISRPPGELVRRVREQCQALDLKLRTIPGIDEIAGGRVNLSRIRPVDLEDLLRREPVSTDDERIRELVSGQTVMVTGAGGSIGSELCRQLLAMRPAALVMVERSENALYDIDNELAPIGPPEVLRACVADVADSERVEAILREHRPRVVFHAAAHKHVPMMERNPGEALKNNVLGTQRLVDACIAADVERFVLISTDKAVNPTSVMGATKRIAERYVIAVAQETGRAYSAVRFGNVLGSNGSVVPLFRRQLADGGPLTVTHPEVKRYFMTIPEAVQLVTQTAVMGTGGDIFVLDMGEQIKILDLARDLIQLSGLEEGRDIEIRFIGLRAGEKLYEELGLQTEAVTNTSHPKILRWRGPRETSVRSLRSLFAAIDAGRADPRDHITMLVPEYAPPERVITLADNPPVDRGPLTLSEVGAE